MSDLDRQLDPIGPLGPKPPPAGESFEVGRFPIEIEGKWITELDPDGTTHRVYSYAKAETGDDRQ